jgi:hypothetical protein
MHFTTNASFIVTGLPTIAGALRCGDSGRRADSRPWPWFCGYHGTRQVSGWAFTGEQ